MNARALQLQTADTPDRLEAARIMFREYAEGLGVDLSFQSFEQELRALPGDYAAPRGRLVLAFVDGALAGCGAFRPCAAADYADACEMKRLYVRRVHYLKADLG